MKIFHYKGYHNCDSKCGVSIIGGDNDTTVVLTELPDNPGTSVTNFVEGIATAVVRELLPRFPIHKIKWVDHYFAVKPLQPETFDNVKLDWDGGRAVAERDGQFHNPEWSPMDKEEARKIKEQIIV